MEVGPLIFLRIIAVLFVSSAAGDLNRNKYSWGLFAFFLPSLSMIFIGLQKKLFPNLGLTSVMSSDEKVQVLLSHAIKSKNDLSYTDSLYFLDELLKLSPGNKDALQLVDNINKERQLLSISDNEIAKLPKFSRKTNSDMTIKIIHRDGICVDAVVIGKDGIAADGWYEWDSDLGLYRVRVTNGKIVEKEIIDC